MIERALLIGVLTLGAGLFWLIGQWDAIVAREIEGDVIRALSLAIPIMGAFTLWWLKQQADQRGRDKEHKKRRDRILVALRAEIDMQLDQHLEQFGADVAPAYQASMIASMYATPKKEHSMPVGVVPKENDVFDHIKPELADLPSDVIGKVIRYYQADEYVTELIKSFSSGAFEKTSQVKREKVIKGYYGEGHTATMAAFDALDALNDALKDGKDLSPEKQKAREALRALDNSLEAAAPNKSEIKR